MQLFHKRYLPFPMLGSFLFILFAIVAIAAALGVLIARSPVSSALWLILNLFCIAGLYLTLNAQFIAVVQVLVYAGAIMVLFLFVIMLLNLSAMPQVANFNWTMAASFVVGAGVLALLVYVVAAGLQILPVEISAAEMAINGSAERLALDLFTVYLLPFEVIGVLLLATTIGAVMLARRRFV